MSVQRMEARRRYEREQLPAPYVHPAPQVPARPVVAGDEIPRSAALMARKALAAGWRTETHYMRGWELKATRTKITTGEPAETVAVRFRRGAERAVATWSRRVDGGKWAFELAYSWGRDHPISRRSSTELAAYLVRPPVDQVIEANAA